MISPSHAEIKNDVLTCTLCRQILVSVEFASHCYDLHTPAAACVNVLVVFETFDFC